MRDSEFEPSRINRTRRLAFQTQTEMANVGLRERLNLPLLALLSLSLAAILSARAPSDGDDASSATTAAADRLFWWLWNVTTKRVPWDATVNCTFYNRTKCTFSDAFCVSDANCRIGERCCWSALSTVSCCRTNVTG